MAKRVYTPIKPPGQCACINVRRASGAITEFYNAILMPSGLKITQYSLLRNLQRLGPVNMTRLAEEVRLDRTTLARNLKPMQEHGLVDVGPGRDGRTRRVAITGQGFEALEKALPLWEEAQNRVSTYLGEDTLRSLTAGLSKLELLGG